MPGKKNVIGICGSASKGSSNLSILQWIGQSTVPEFNLEIVDGLHQLPHFQTELTNENVPEAILDLRKKIMDADGVIFCTPEYVFSIPSGLKNMIEWCVSTTVFSDKHVGIITASTSGEKGHEELQMILKTVQAQVSADTSLLLAGVKSKVDRNGQITKAETEGELLEFIRAFNRTI